MNVNSINSINVSRKLNNSFKTNEQPPQKTEPEKKANNSKLPYVGGAIILAGIGAYAFRHKLGLVKEIKKIVPEADKAPQKLLPLLPPKAEKTAPAVVTEVVSEIVPQKVVVEQEKKNSIANLVQSLKNKAESYKSFKDVNVKDEAVFKKMADINKKYSPISKQIVIDNTSHTGFVNVPVLEKVAKDFSIDANRPDRFRQAAVMAEESYKSAYLKDYAQNAKGLDGVLNRTTKESPVLFEIYANLPYPDAIQRIKLFAEELPKAKAVAPESMSKGVFFEKMSEAFDKFIKKA